MDNLEARTAFITGGTSGIGFGMALVFARAGMNVVISDVRDKELERAGQELRQISGNVLTLNVDSQTSQHLRLHPPRSARLSGIFMCSVTMQAFLAAARSWRHRMSVGATRMKSTSGDR